ncbi:GNAT family N-acetyltransferase [Marinigracilibium pacificum]|uniref:GNAT family N-acetyltransferase n=1 Tax=Marinigracilibium pacificum TaxID=2729599 RepID=A0A848J911_9BACT|nr:GNAT family N-acetyltransferase [Marinigracilibium pacificum]NMM50869.1 GNAT family N-acetyltransferase [Marinigracilibium pacificum]
MIRKYHHNSDFSAVIELFRLNTPQYFDPEEQGNLEAYLNDSNHHYFVKEENNKVIGCGGYHMVDSIDDMVRLSWDIVHPDHHGKGVGSELIKYILKLVREEGDARKAEVWTSQIANSFYYKFGFRSIEMVKDYWADGFDLYRMQMELK